MKVDEKTIRRKIEDIFDNHQVCGHNWHKSFKVCDCKGIIISDIVELLWISKFSATRFRLVMQEQEVKGLIAARYAIDRELANQDRKVRQLEREVHNEEHE